MPTDTDPLDDSVSTSDRRATWVGLRTLRQRPKTVGQTARGEPVFEVRSVQLVLRPDATQFNRLLHCSKCGTDVVGRRVFTSADLDRPPNPVICTSCVRIGAPPSPPPPQPRVARVPKPRPARPERAARARVPEGEPAPASARPPAPTSPSAARPPASASAGGRLDRPGARLTAIEARLAELAAGVAAAPAPADVAAGDARLAAVEARLAELAAGVAAAPAPADVAAGDARLAAVEARLTELAAGDARLAAVEARLEELAAGVAALAVAAEAPATTIGDEVQTAMAELLHAQGEDLAALSQAVAGARAELGQVGEWARQLTEMQGQLDARLSALAQRVDTQNAATDERVEALHAAAAAEAGRAHALEERIQVSMRRMTRLVGAQGRHRPPVALAADPPAPPVLAPATTAMLDDLERQLRDAEARLARRSSPRPDPV